ncbi:hypothetical protein E8P77_02670 [Soehngenia saccharolytica]|nr:hypothetical protein E8P77_02670 [Soehngenia saccharolytica]
MKRARVFTSLILALAMLITMIPMNPTNVFAEKANHVVISEAYGGGGNSGATYKNDFIELYNPTLTDIDISGWQIQYASATGTFGTNNLVLPNAVIKAGGYFLIQAAAGAGGTVDLPTPDATCNIAMSGTNFKLKLLDNNGNVVDLLGVGTANEYETKATPAVSNTTSAQRKDNDGSQAGITNGWDTDNNSEDFYIEAPTPRNSLYQGDNGGEEPVEPETPEIILLPISEAKTKPANEIVTVKGIATYSTQARTIFMQDETAGVAIDSGGNSTFNLPNLVGKEVQITGKISLYGGMVQIVPQQSTDIVVVNESPAMPNPLELTIPEIISSNRAHEGMLVKITSAKLTQIGGSDTTKLANHKVEQNGVEITLRSHGINDKVVGDYVDILGVIGYYNSPQIQANGTDVVKALPPSVVAVETNPANGSSIKLGAIVTLSTPTEGAHIVYSLNGGEEVATSSNTAEAVIREFDAEHKATIVAKAVKGEEESLPNTFVYYHAKTSAVTANPVGAVSDGDIINLSASENAVIKYIITYNVGTEDETISEEFTYTTPIVVDKTVLPMNITAFAIEEDYLDSDPVVFSYYLKSNAPYRNYYGQLHSHTAENSDGSGTLADAYAYAKNVAKLDFFAVTDHSNSFDTAPSADKYPTYNLVDYNSNNVKWQNGLRAAENARDENFISIYGYEMTWSGGPGHMNTFNTTGFVSRNNTELNNKTNNLGLQQYYQLLKDTPNSISQFNHPGPTFGNFADFAYLDPVIDQRISLIEVGNGEGAVGSGGYFRSYDQYIKALDKGWHLAPTNNQDNHKGKWGDANTARTVIYTNDLSVDGLYAALREMRVWATEDNNLDVVYTLNDNLLGTILDDVPESATIKVSVNDPDANDKIQTLSIISNGGKAVVKESVGANSIEFETTIEDPTPGYYFVQVVQEDGDIAVTAPVWLGSAPKLGIDSLFYDQMMPVTDESLKITTKLFNNESTPVTLKSIEYQLKNGSVIYSGTPNQTIPASGGMITNEITHTFTTPGKYTVLVTAVVESNGEEITFTKDLDINVRDRDKLIYVGIDASHDNEYVAGNYKASMGNFATLAANYDIRVVELNTSEELLSALNNPKYEMFIFTVPSRRNGTTGRIPWKSYSEAEIQAVENFAKQGKTLILTGWGDYYENYTNLKNDPSFTHDQHMAAQQNKILEAIGARLRITDDEAKDNVLNGGQAQRLYLTDHNGYVNPFTQGLDPSQVFSQYGGSTIHAVDENGLPTSVLPNSVSPIISGHETTFSSDDDKDRNPLPPKYNDRLLLMASEEVTYENGNTATIIAAGGAFMSNFEVQVEVENAGTLPYSNYNIVENILVSLKDVNKISEVHSLPIGTQVMVEGIVTTDVYNGTDDNKGFFDCIYIQDETGGINVFPVSSGVEVGQKVRVLGNIDQYQGEKEIQVQKLTVIDSTKNPVEPLVVSPQEAIASENIGRLVKFTGTVQEIKTDANGVVGQLTVDGVIVYINGYITKSVSLSHIKVGDRVEVTGISSIGENMSSETEFLPRIRVRDRSEIVVLENSVPVVPQVPVDTTSNAIAPNINIVGENLNAKVSASSLESALKYAKENKENSNGKVVIDIDIDNYPQVNNITFNIPRQSLQLLSKEADMLVINTGLAKIQFNRVALSEISNNGLEDADINITIAKRPNDIQGTIGEYIYDFSIKSGDAVIDNFDKGTARVTIPYENNDDNALLVVYRVSQDDSLIIVPFSQYIDNEGMRFMTNHFSEYLIGHKKVDFEDVKSNSWYYEPVNFVASRDIFKGIDEKKFDPNGTLTRAMFVTALARLDGAELEGYSNIKFKDVNENSWYENAVEWAVFNGIVKGYDETTFGPNDEITREQMAVILDRYLNYKNIEIERKQSDNFLDSNQISAWAKDSVMKIHEYELVQGVGGNRFDPQGKANRASASTIFMNLIIKSLAQ